MCRLMHSDYDVKVVEDVNRLKLFIPLLTNRFIYICFFAKWHVAERNTLIVMIPSGVLCRTGQVIQVQSVAIVLID